LPRFRSLLGLASVMSLALAGCAVSPEKFYSDPGGAKNTSVCRAYFDAVRDGRNQYAADLWREISRRRVSEAECKNLVASENVAVGAIALVGTGILVAAACKDGCPSGGGGAAPSSTVVVDDDVDCFGGTGDGPRYIKGPFVLPNRMVDPYDLDRDNDGIACEIGEGG